MAVWFDTTAMHYIDHEATMLPTAKANSGVMP